MLIKVNRLSDVVMVKIMKHKVSGKYSFVNLTKEHIRPCVFDTIDDALLDLDSYDDIISYEILDSVEFKEIK